MSAPLVRYSVFANGRLAAKRCAALLGRAYALCAQLEALAGRWQDAERMYGADFPQWSFGDWQLPDFAEDLAQRAAKVMATRFQEYSSTTAKLVAAGDSQIAHIHRDDPVLAGKAASMSKRRLRRLFRERFEAFGSGEISRIGNTFGASDKELEAVTRDVGELEEVVRELAGRVHQARSALGLARVRSTFAATHRLATESKQGGSAAAIRQQASPERADASVAVSTLLGRLSAHISDAHRDTIGQAARRVLDAPAGRRRMLLTQLRLEIQRANEVASARRQAVRQVDEWRERLLGLEGAEAEQLDAVLRQHREQGVAPAHLAQQVDHVVARATEAEDREYALGVIREELENLGYEVEVGFDTAGSDGQTMLLRNPAMVDGYLVSVTAEGAGLRNEVVREANDPSDGALGSENGKRQQTDEEMQTTWCQHLAKALAAAERRGVRGQAAERSNPGAAPVRAIAPLSDDHRPSREHRRRRRRGALASRRIG